MARPRKLKLNDLFHSQRYRLFYIAPERLQIKTFYDELRATLHDTPLGALVIDEAHCVSEWGHDFRPAYLQIPRLRRLLEESARRRVPLLALTATASPLVRADMLDTLQLAPDDLLQTASSDRRNISLSVHPVPAEAGAKSKALAHLLTDDLPRALGQPYGFDFLEANDDRYREAGIVFAIYADPHGKTTFAEGTAQIAAELSKTLGLSKDQVRTYASRVPKVCPQCGSHDYWKATPRKPRRPALGVRRRNAGTVPKFSSNPSVLRIGTPPCNSTMKTSNRIDFRCWSPPKASAWALTSAMCPLWSITPSPVAWKAIIRKPDVRGAPTSAPMSPCYMFHPPRPASATRLIRVKCRAA